MINSHVSENNWLGWDREDFNKRETFSLQLIIVINVQGGAELTSFPPVTKHILCKHI